MSKEANTVAFDASAFEGTASAAPEGHDEAMAQVFENQGVTHDSDAGAQENAQRPQWLPEKFKSPEDMARAYGELEKKLSQNAPPQKEQGTETSKPQDEGNDGEPQKITIDTMMNEFFTDGKVSPETLKALNITQEHADTLIQGQQALMASTKKEVMDITGGEENFKAMREWAQQNVESQQLEAFDQAMGMGPEVAKLAINGLYSQFKNAGGPKIIRGNGQGGQNEKPITSSQEMLEAMRDPRYKTSPSYRESVERRIGLK